MSHMLPASFSPKLRQELLTYYLRVQTPAAGQFFWKHLYSNEQAALGDAGKQVAVSGDPVTAWKLLYDTDTAAAVLAVATRTSLISEGHRKYLQMLIEESLQATTIPYAEPPASLSTVPPVNVKKRSRRKPDEAAN